MKRLVVVFLLLVFLLAAYGFIANQKTGNIAKTEGEDFTATLSEADFSVWTTYWDLADLEAELRAWQDKVTKVCFFAAYFQEREGLFVPEETLASFARVEKLYSSKDYKSYLTFVNDLVMLDKTASLKNVNLLYALLATEESIDKHVTELVALTSREGFDGLEIDYEGIKADLQLWELFTEFIQKLYEAASQKGLAVRVVLEPAAPLEQITLPEGPEYVLMCYNLHGYGTEPGPKANPAFIQKMIAKMKDVSGEVAFALATGGFDFSDNLVTSLTEREAVELALLYNRTPARDEESQALYFSYIDENGSDHEVWFSDANTIKYWSDIIQKAGDYNLSLWKIGGNIIRPE